MRAFWPRGPFLIQEVVLVAAKPDFMRFLENIVIAITLLALWTLKLPAKPDLMRLSAC